MPPKKRPKRSDKKKDEEDLGPSEDENIQEGEKKEEEDDLNKRGRDEEQGEEEGLESLHRNELISRVLGLTNQIENLVVQIEDQAAESKKKDNTIDELKDRLGAMNSISGDKTIEPKIRGVKIQDWKEMSNNEIMKMAGRYGVTLENDDLTTLFRGGEASLHIKKDVYTKCMNKRNESKGGGGDKGSEPDHKSYTAGSSLTKLSKSYKIGPKRDSAKNQGPKDDNDGGGKKDQKEDKKDDDNINEEW